MNLHAFSPADPRRAATPQEDLFAGLCLFTAMTSNEVVEVLPPPQARAFFQAVGRRMAALETLAGVSDTVELCARANAFWQALGWGRIDIAVEDNAIMVRHRNAPLAIPGCDAEHWQVSLSALLEGAWDSWFRTLGSGSALVTTAHWQGDCLELRHGR